MNGCCFYTVADFPTIRDTDIMVRVDLKESRPLRVGIQGSVSTTGDDAGLVFILKQALLYRRKVRSSTSMPLEERILLHVVSGMM